MLEMPDTGRAALLLVMFAAFVGVATARRAPGPPSASVPAERFVAADHPVAVLAWAKANCNDGLALRAGAHRTHAEILMRVAAAYDHARSRRGLEDVCREAIAAAQPAIAPDTLPKPGTLARTVAAKTAANEK